MEAKQEKDIKDEESSNKSLSVTKRNPSLSSKSHFKVMLNNFTKNKRSIKEDELGLKHIAYSQMLHLIKFQKI